MAVTALTIVESAMRKLGALASGASASSDEQADGLEALNDLISLLSAQGWILPYRTRDDALAVASSANSYSIGSGGDFNTARPIRIDAITINQSSSTPWPLVEGSLEQYNGAKVAQQGLPDFFYYEPVYPLGLIYFPYKLSTDYTVTIDSLKPLGSFSLISSSIDLPPGYEAAYKALLAVHLASEMGRRIPESVGVMAGQAEDFLRTQSNLHRKKFASVDTALLKRGRGFNPIIDR